MQPEQVKKKKSLDALLLKQNIVRYAVLYREDLRN